MERANQPKPKAKKWKPWPLAKVQAKTKQDFQDAFDHFKGKVEQALAKSTVRVTPAAPLTGLVARLRRLLAVLTAVLAHCDCTWHSRHCR